MNEQLELGASVTGMPGKRKVKAGGVQNNRMRARLLQYREFKAVRQNIPRPDR